MCCQYFVTNILLSRCNSTPPLPPNPVRCSDVSIRSLLCWHSTIDSNASRTMRDENYSSSLPYSAGRLGRGVALSLRKLWSILWPVRRRHRAYDTHIFILNIAFDSIHLRYYV